MEGRHTLTKINPVNYIDKLFCDKFMKIFEGFFDVDDGKFILPYSYKDHAEEIENFEVREDDIWVLSYPRSGNTWITEMIWLIMNDCDFEAARRLITFRHFWLDGFYFVPSGSEEELAKFDIHTNIPFMKQFEGRRFMKSHLPWQFLPKQLREGIVKPKIIWIYRNPKDVVVSYYHLLTTLFGIEVELTEFLELFLAGRVPHGSYWYYFKSLWEHRNESNILTLKYEEMKQNLHETVTQVSNFLETPIRPFYMDQLLKHLSFEEMKRNFFCNNDFTVEMFRKMLYPIFCNENLKKGFVEFIRKGKIGSHKEEMNADFIKKFDKWIEENTKGTDLEILFK